MQVIETKARLEDRFVHAYEVNEGHALNGRNERLHGLRQAAIDQFERLGIPAPRAEAYKYTNISKTLRHEYEVHLKADISGVTADDVARLKVPGLDGALVVLVNGRYVADLSDVTRLPEGVVVTSLQDASETQTNVFNAHFAQYAPHEKEALVALNTAFTKEGVFIYVPRNVVVEQPIQVLNLIHTDRDLFMQPRHLFVAEQSAQVKIVEVQQALTATKTFANTVTEVYVARNANVEVYALQDNGTTASQVSALNAYQEADSHFGVHTHTLSGDVVRNNISLLPNAENCETHMFGFFLGTGTTHIDNHTFVDHAMPNCFSNELYKGVLDDKATGVFNGKVMVRQDAQKINAYQSNKAIVLTETAHMYSKPELEIYADDVRCSHGATTGQVEPEAVFYLRSRGLTEHQARKLLLLAFARDVLDNVKVDAFRAYLDDLVSDRLPA